MLLGCYITGFGILLTCFTILPAKEYIILTFIGFTLFGTGLGFYATPSIDAAVSNIPGDKVGGASGIYKMASSLGAALGVAISAAIYYGLSKMNNEATPMAEIFLGKTSNINVRYAAAMGLLFNVLMVLIAIVAIRLTIPKKIIK